MEQIDEPQREVGWGIGGKWVGRDEPGNLHAYMHSSWTPRVGWQRPGRGRDGMKGINGEKKE